MVQDREITVKSVPTPHGTVALTINRNANSTSKTSLLVLHGNSSCSKVFKHVISNPPPEVQQVVAMDYPGHGQSSDATSDPQTAYTMRGYAESAIAVLKALGVSEVIAFGWSLGGHVAIEMVALLEQPSETGIRCRGIMITGTPPALGLDQVQRGFDPSNNAGNEQTAKDKKQDEKDETEAEEEGEHMNLAEMEVWREEEYETFPQQGHGRPYEQWMTDMARRTDGRSRRYMFGAFKGGVGVDQVRVVETSEVPCAVVNGANEPFVNLDYLDAIKYKNLWEGKCYRIPDLGHTPFWEKPEVFEPYLSRFVQYCTSTA